MKLGFSSMIFNYCEIAPVGQVPQQAPQSIQVSSLTLHLPSSARFKEPVGHTSVQAPQPTQVSASTLTGIIRSSLQK